MDIITSGGRPADTDVQALAVAVFKDEKADEGILEDLDAAAGGVISSILDAEEMKGKEGESAYIHLSAGGGLKAKRLLLVGVGAREDYNLAQASRFAGTATRTLRARNVKSVGFVPRLDGGDAGRVAAAAVEWRDYRVVRAGQISHRGEGREECREPIGCRRRRR